MRKKYLTVLMFCIMAVNIGSAGSADKIEVEIHKTWEIGKENLMFASIASICEDPETNFYVLDRMEHRVLKFSPEGKLIQTFGQKGQGPGDFQNPHLLAFTPNGRLVVADDLFNLSFLNEKGHFIDRIHLDGRLAVGFIGEDRYYAWIWGEEDQSQVMVDAQNNVLETFFSVPKSAFSVSAPDESGRRVMFNFSRSEFAPSLQFAHSRRFSAVGVGNRYEILILDENGNTASRVRREVQPDSFSKNEKQYLAEEIEAFGKERGWPGSVVRNIIKKIPDKKIFFDQVLLTEEYVFLFRIKKDICEKNSPVPVDVFSIRGEYLGEIQMPDKPLHISEKHIYFVRSDEEDNLFLEKGTYRLIRN